MTAGGRAGTVTLDPRFNGPDGTANGGYACGLAAGFVSGAADVMLRRPPPLGRPLTVHREDSGAVQIRADATVVIDVRHRREPITAPPPVDLGTATEISADPALLASHPFPRCFVCGPDRADGLGIFPGLLGDGLVAAPWVPTADLADDHDEVGTPFVWAALDCPSGWSASSIALPGTVSVLGRMSAVIHRHPQAGVPCVAVGQAGQRDGRKSSTSSALYDGDGRLLAAADATWIAIA